MEWKFPVRNILNILVYLASLFFSENFRKCDSICVWKFLEVKTGIVA